MGSITIIGLGPGDAGHITLESLELMTGAEALYLRTAKHPTVEYLVAKGIKFTSYDDFYEGAEDFESLYDKIARDLLAKANSQDLVYAVPGSPMVAERTVVLLRKYAKEKGIDLKIIPAMSFVEVLYGKLGIDPIEGLTILEAGDIEKIPVDMPTGMVITQVYAPHIASEAKLSLMEILPDEYPIIYTHKLGMKDEIIREIPLYELDRQENIDYLTSIYIPPMPRQEGFDIGKLKDIIRTLREPGGCPWDIAQTHKTIRQNLIEEAYEVIEAIDLEDEYLLREELGDLLLQVVFHGQMAEEAGLFTMQEVIDEVMEKLVRRHPHVFGEIRATDATAALLSWEQVKAREKAERKSVLDGVPKGLPALMAAWKLQKKASKVGFDWDDIKAVWDKLSEEIEELKEAVREKDSGHMEEELGDVLFSVVNIARFIGVEPEVALTGCNRKFKSRFSFVEKTIKEKGLKWEDMSLPELDEIWNMAKKS